MFHSAPPPAVYCPIPVPQDECLPRGKWEQMIYGRSKLYSFEQRFPRVYITDNEEFFTDLTAPYLGYPTINGVRYYFIETVMVGDSIVPGCFPNEDYIYLAINIEGRWYVSSFSKVPPDYEPKFKRA